MQCDKGGDIGGGTTIAVRDDGGDDVQAMPHEELERAIVELSTQIDAAEHRLLTLIRELERRGRYASDGQTSMVAWLGWRVGLGTVAAREKVRVARALGELPKIDAALARGEVSYSKVRAMTRVANSENEAKLLHMATQATASQLERICRGVEAVTALSEAGMERWVRVVPDKDGMVKLEARLFADEASLLMKAIEIARGDSAESNPDALVSVAEAYIANDASRNSGRCGGDRHQLLVTVRSDELAPTGVSAEASPGGVAVPPETLRRMACDAAITEVVVDDGGAPVEVGRKTRTIPPSIRRALHVRDGKCQFPGCSHRSFLDAHHIDHWIDGGPTTRDNLVLLCTFHHQLVHEGSFTLAREAASGTVVFRRPDGSAVDPIPSAPHVMRLSTTLRPPRPPANLRPDYHWAIGMLVPRRAA